MNDRQKNQELIEFRKNLKLTQTEFASILDQPQSLVAMIENGTRKAPQSFKEALLKKYNFTLSELNDVSIDVHFPKDIIAIPTHDISASAGAGNWVDREPEQDVLYFDKRFLKQLLKRDDFSSIHIIHAQGDSMDSGWNQPDDIRDGDLLMVDTSQTTGSNQVFVILVNNSELRVKRLTKRGDTLYITSNNPKYKEEIYRSDDSDIEVKVIGKVVWHGK